MNAANEVAVDAFLHGNLAFPGIWETVAAVMNAHHVNREPTLDQLLAADFEARESAREILTQ